MTDHTPENWAGLARTAKAARIELGIRIKTHADLVADRLDDEYSGMTTLRRITALEETLEQTKRAVVESMRAAGWTWIRIGEALGVSKQAAQKKYQV